MTDVGVPTEASSQRTESFAVESSRSSRNRSCWTTTDVGLRQALLDFIADFANWDNSTVPAFLDTSRPHPVRARGAGRRARHPAARRGPVCRRRLHPARSPARGRGRLRQRPQPGPVLLNKVVLEYIPKYGQRLADEVRKWGEWIKREAEKELAEFYPKDADGATPIAYLWARTIQCEGPGCGAEVPLIRSLWLAKKANRSVALQLVPNPKAKRVDFQIIVKQRDGWVDQANPKTKIENPKFEGTVKRGSATCPCCGYTTPVARVREQLKARRGGANDARLFCCRNDSTRRTRPRSIGCRPQRDSDAFETRSDGLEARRQTDALETASSLVPDEPTRRTRTRGAIACHIDLWMETLGRSFHSTASCSL